MFEIWSFMFKTWSFSNINRSDEWISLLICAALAIFSFVYMCYLLKHHAGAYSASTFGCMGIVALAGLSVGIVIFGSGLEPAVATTCTNCGAELAGEFCHKCGAAVDTIVKCAKCGLEAIGDFCHGCGAVIK